MAKSSIADGKAIPTDFIPRLPNRRTRHGLAGRDCKTPASTPVECEFLGNHERTDKRLRRPVAISYGHSPSVATTASEHLMLTVTVVGMCSPPALFDPASEASVEILPAIIDRMRRSPCWSTLAFVDARFTHMSNNNPLLRGDKERDNPECCQCGQWL